MKLLSVVLMALLVMVAACTPPPASGDKDTGLRYISEFEGGKLYRAGPVSVVELKGGYRQMGRQYGALLKSDMNELYERAINGEYVRKQQFTFERLKAVGDFIFQYYPRRYKEILYGMAETSGLGLDKQLILNAIEWPPKVGKTSPLCSGIGVWGDYTKDGSLIFGRNNDDTPFFRDFAKYMTVAVFKANDHTLNTAIINYTGVIYAANGMNSGGVFLELNSGNAMGFFPDRTSILVTLMEFLQDYPTIREMSAAFQSSRVNLSSIVSVADKDVAYAFELPPEGAKRREPDGKGLMVATNHFMDPAWKLPQPANDEKQGWTVKRRDNLMALAEKNKGQLDIARMMQVLDMPLEQGGATMEGTAFQIITAPKDFTLWIKAPGNFDWQKVDISQLLK
jgi:hypothetical protein